MLCNCQYCRGQLLSPDEKTRLTIFKWRYTAEVNGFDRREADTLVFTRWRLMNDVVQQITRSTIW